MNIHELDSYDLGDAVKFNDRLNPRIWGADEKMRPEVREQLLKIADDFREFLGIDVEVKDITVSGSNAAYTYTPHSDIDLHLVVDLPEADRNEVYRELFDAKKYAYNDQHDIRIGDYDVELYVQDANKPHHSQGIYSIMNDDWISVPRRRRPNVDDISVKSKFEDLGHRIEDAIKSADYEKINALAEKIKDYRQAGLDAHGEFGPENLAFKILRKQGLIEKLYAARNDAKDRMLSLDERRKKKKKVRYGYGGYWYPGTAYAGQDHPAGTEGGDAGGGDGGAESLREAASKNDEQILRDFIKFCVAELKIEHMPQVKLRRDPQWPKVHKTFGRYIDDAKTLEVAWGNRHIMDVLRTVAHELTHKRQHEREDVPPSAGETGSEYENEANARAGILMRDWARLHPEYFSVGQAHDLEESASGYIPTKAQARDPRFSMALTVDIKPGQVGKEANKLKLKTDKQGHPQIARANGLFENLYKEYKRYKADEDYSPDNPPGPESKPTMPAGTLRVDVSDMYDWYKLGQHIANMKGLGHHDFGKGPPSTIIGFGSEDEEHKFIKDLEATGLDVTDIDPATAKKPAGKKIKTDPTYNVDEAIQAPVSKEQRAADDYYRFIVGKIRLGRVLNRQEQEFFKTYNLKKKLAEFAPTPDRGDDGEGSDYLTQLANRWWNAADPRDQNRIADVIRTFGYEITQVESEDDAVQLTDIRGKDEPIFISADEFDPDLNEADEKRRRFLGALARGVGLGAVGVIGAKYGLKNKEHDPDVTFAQRIPDDRDREKFMRLLKQREGYKAQQMVGDTTATAALVINSMAIKKYKKQMAEKYNLQDDLHESLLNEYRDRMYQYIKNVVPGFPDYVVRDWLYANFARGATQGPGWSFETIGKDIPKILADMGLSVNTQWKLVPNMKFTMDMWEPTTLKRLQARAGGSSTSTDPDVHIPKNDAERHATQAQLAQQQGGVRKEPVILIKTAKGYELLEGWHRTIQHFARYPDGYVGPAYVAVASNSTLAEDTTTYPKVLYHGSTQEIKGPLTPRQAHDIGGAAGSNKNAIYATDDPNFAIAYSLAERGSDTGTFGWKKEPRLIFFGGKIRHGQNVYLHVLPTRDAQGRPLFTRGDADAEWYSVPGVTAITPIKVITKPVDRYLHLLRKPTPEEQKIFQANKAKQPQAVTETAEEEAWELVGQPVPEIQQLVKQLGLTNDETGVARIVPVIKAAPDTQLPAASIPKLKNLANKPGDPAILKAIQKISGRADAAEQYATIMARRDAGEGRDRGYTVGNLIAAVKSGNYESPVLLKLPTGVYVIGGRTRLYAALALNMPIRVKILTPASFAKQAIKEDEDLDEVKMSPGALEKFATSPEAKGIRAGFEAELIFRDTQGESEELDPEPNYDADERAYSIQQVIDFFSNDEYGYGIGDRQIRRLEEELDEKYLEWRDEQIMADFRNEAEDLVRERFLEEQPMAERIHAVLVDGMELSDEEADRIQIAGEKTAPRFNTSKEEQDYADQNPDYKIYLEALNDAETILDEEVESCIAAQDGMYDSVLDDFRDNWSGDDDSFFSDVGLRWMSDIANEFNLDWPVWDGGEQQNYGNRGWEDIGASLQAAVDMPVVVSSDYHSTRRRPGQWIIEPDGSLDPDDKSEEAGLEIVSPPMPLLTAIEKLKAVVDWANDPERGNAYTNSSTGLHMGVSLPTMKSEDATDDIGIDYVKLILFMGDKYVQQQFGREANTYCASALDKLKQNIKGKRSDPAGVVKLLQHGLTELAHRELQKGVGTSKYTSAHIQDGYIEFRSPGGDWLAKADEEIGVLENTMLRFARAMAIAGDPNAERQEYAKKLYKLVTADNPEYADQLKLFSEFSAGTINKEQLKKQWAETVLQKELPGTGKEEYEVFRQDNKDSPDATVGTLYARDYDDAYDQFLRQYGRDINTLDVRIKQPWFDVFDDAGRVVKTIRAKDADTATDRAQYEFGQQWTDAWNIYRRPDDTPEPKASPRAQVAKRIVKPQAPAVGDDAASDWEAVYKPTGRVFDTLAHADSAQAQIWIQSAMRNHQFTNADDIVLRRVGHKQAVDARTDSADLQRNLGVRDVEPDVAQNFEPQQSNWDIYQSDDPSRVVNTLIDATERQVQDWLRRQETQGMPPGFLSARRQTTTESINPVSGAGAVAPRPAVKNTDTTKKVQPVEPVYKKQAYRSAIGQAISQQDLENMTRQIQTARKLGDDINENFADGRVKGKSRPGRVKRAGASCKGSVTDLRARAKKYGGEKGRMYHWCANMKSGRNKNK